MYTKKERQVETMNKINRMISNYNYNPGNISRIKYIVIHYVGALGGAQENCAYYGGGNRGASAHYFVGFAGEIWQCVEDRNIAWHLGRAAISIQNAEMPTVSESRCACERRTRRVLGQQIRTGILKEQQYSLLLS